MSTECVNGVRFGCTCRECWPDYRPETAPYGWRDREKLKQEQEKRDAEQFAKLQRLMQEPSVFERDADTPPAEPAQMPGDPWRERVIEQIRHGATYGTLVLTFQDWQDFLGEDHLL